MDLVPLARASAVLRRDAAVHGLVLAERQPGGFAASQIQAATFWAFAAALLRAEDRG